MLELRHLRALSAIRQGGSLVAAAERLHLTQSALSHQIKEIEGQFDISLLHRRPLRFTPAGERLLALADAVLPLCRDAERDIARIRGGRQGRLVMAIECHSCFEWLMPALDRFRRDWPDVELDFAGGFREDAQDSLRQGDLDLVVTSNPGTHPDIACLPLFRYESVLLVAPDHPFAARPWIAPEDLRPETLVAYPIDPDRLDVLRYFLHPAGVEPARVRTTELTLMAVQLAAGGRGVTALPNWAAAEFLARGWVKAVRLGPEGVWCTLYAAVRAADRELAFLSDFLATARETCFNHLQGIRAAESADADRQGDPAG